MHFIASGRRERLVVQGKSEEISNTFEEFPPMQGRAGLITGGGYRM
jgi:hypothetical protein